MKNLDHLIQYIDQRGRTSGTDNFTADQATRAAALPEPAREMALWLTNAHSAIDLSNNGHFNAENQRYKALLPMLAQQEPEGKSLWASADFDKFWGSILPKHWEAPVKQCWPSLPQNTKLETLNCLANWWFLHEVDMYEYIGFYVQQYDGNFPFASIATVAIDSGDKRLLENLLTILQGDAELGEINYIVLTIAMGCNRPEAWEAVNKLLLAAQRQEGLRQMILGLLMNAQPGAKILLLETILDNKLQRFASVLASLQNWLNLPLADGVATSEINIERLGRMALRFMKEEKQDVEAIFNGNDFTECYLRLWSTAQQRDKSVFWQHCERLMQSPDHRKRAMTIHATSLLRLKAFDFAKKHCHETDLMVCWNLFKRMESMYGDETYDRTDGSFEFFGRLVAAVPDTGLKNPKPQFVWENYQYDVKPLFLHWAYRVCWKTNRHAELLPYSDRLDGDLRQGIFTGHFRPVFDLIYAGKTAEFNFQPNDFERNWVLSAIQDKSSTVTRAGFQLYALLSPRPEELPTLLNLLTRKSDDTRKSLLAALLKLGDADLQSSIQTLLAAKTEEQRTAGLDLLQQLKKQGRLAGFVTEAATAFAQRKNISSKEQPILHDILDGDSETLDATNGYSLYDPQQRAEIPVLAKPTKGFFMKKMYKQPLFGLSVSMEKLEAELRKLDALFVQHENYEYEVENWDKSNIKVLLSTGNLQQIKQYNRPLTQRESLDNLPLPDVWEGWFKASGLCLFDLYILSNYATSYPFDATMLIPDWLKELAKDYSQSFTVPIFIENRLKLKYPMHCQTMVNYLFEELPIKAQIISVEMDMTHHYFASIPAEGLFEKMKGYSYNQEASQTWRDVFKAKFDNFSQWEIVNEHVPVTPAAAMDDTLFKQYWDIVYWYYRHLPDNYQGFNVCEATTLGRAFELGLVGKDESYHLILTTPMFSQINANIAWNPNGQLALKKYPIFQEMLDKAVPKFLAFELKRGDTKTPVSDFVCQFTGVYGIGHFIKIIKGLGKDSLHRGYAYGGDSKLVQFSRLLKNCHPAPTDSYEGFKAALDAEKFTQNRLVQVALYAPQWLPWMERYLQWPGLEAAAWCLHAHAHNYFDVQKTSELAKYTSVPAEDFADGAVDVAWFREVHEQLGAERWEQVYDGAHYICDNQGYIRARVYADAILGKLTLNDCKSKVSDKRNKDYLVAIGLVPLPAQGADAEILSRYRFLQEFIKQGKEFGQQRQASEKRASELALDNLARTAGYPDPIRLTWAMETLDVQDMLQKAESVNLDGTTVRLEVNALGKAEVLAVKGEKALAAVPTTLKKDPAVQALTELKNKLNNQYGRIKKSLEEAMIRGDEFQFQELENLMKHPVIRPLLASLVLVSDKKLGFFDPKGLPGVDGKVQPLKAESSLRIAHCCDLQAAGQWALFQKLVFQKSIVQPFKQVFRELYLPSADEMASQTLSNRYAGHEVQTGQAAALFRARGWSARYGEGLQKAFHRQRIVVMVEAYADWFNAGQSTVPTELKSIRFYKKNNWTPLPLQEVPAPIFSETMRDLDLVVSVAHVGGVDPEASLSSTELRAVIVEETAALFGLTNVRVEKSHVFIEGKRGSYTIHLGSAIVHKKPAQMLNISPVHTQARGRLFLPFVDEDPRTAEVVSKVLLLAKDGEIMDPTVLEQL